MTSCTNPQGAPEDALLLCRPSLCVACPCAHVVTITRSELPFALLLGFRRSCARAVFAAGPSPALSLLSLLCTRSAPNMFLTCSPLGPSQRAALSAQLLRGMLFGPFEAADGAATLPDVPQGSHQLPVRETNTTFPRTFAAFLPKTDTFARGAAAGGITNSMPLSRNIWSAHLSSLPLVVPSTCRPFHCLALPFQIGRSTACASF